MKEPAIDLAKDQVPPSQIIVTELLRVNAPILGTNGIAFKNRYCPETVTVMGSPGVRLLTGVDTPECVPLTLTVKLLKLKFRPAMYVVTTF